MIRYTLSAIHHTLCMIRYDKWQIMDQYIFIYPFSAISLSAIHRVMKSVMNGRYASSAIRYTFVRTTDEKCDEWHIMHINTFIYPLSAIHHG